MGYEASLTAVHPVLLYFYTLSVTNQYTKSRKTIFILLPVVVFILVVPILINFLPSNRLDIINEFNVLEIFNLTGIIVMFVMFFLMGYIFFYFLFNSYKALKKYRIEVLHIYSYKDNIDLLWLRRLVIYFAISFLISIFLSLTLYLVNISLIFTDFVFYLSLVIFVFLLAFWGYQQGNIFQHNRHLNILNSNGGNIPINKSELYKNGDYIKEAKELGNIMVKNKPYLNPTLCIHDLAQTMNVPAHQLSKIIHKELGKNFFEYINEFRINHFKNSIKSSTYKDYTLLGIALECGFNSKSAFNRIFKEYTGLTPGDYKKSNNS
jgi:AraC-like DNA-binding protein